MNTGRVVVITGAGGCVGALLVKRFVDNGNTVVATDAKRARSSACAIASRTPAD